jgi:iron(III) transport system ATP-binding protein
MSEIQVENLTKRYGNLTAVDDVSFTARAGELTSLVGPSGCGKTTTLRCVAGLERPEEGRILIGDEVVTDPANDVFKPPHARDIGFVFQTFDVWPHMSVFENVAYPLRNRDVSEDEIERRVNDTLELTDIGDQADKPASQLSGGQQARVGISRALVYEPRVLLFDEPLTGLDRNLRKQMRYEIKRIQMDLDITSLYVTHSQPEAMTLSDTICLMNPNGKIEQMGSGEEIYHRPRSRFAFEFFGAMDPLEGRVTEPGRIETEGLGTLEYSNDGSRTAGDVAVGFRPENVEFSQENRWEDGNTFKGILEDLTFLGELYELTVDIKGSTIRARKSRLDEEFTEGDEIYLHIDPNQVNAYPEGEFYAEAG